jgi:hypothetical protein
LEVEEISADFSVFAEYENKVTMITLRKFMQIALLQSANKVSSVYFINENTATMHFSLMFPKLNPLNKIFISTIDRLIESGHVLQFERNWNFVDGSRLLNEQQPQVLTMDHIGVCFVAIMVFLGLSCVVFVLEHIAKKINN